MMNATYIDFRGRGERINKIKKNNKRMDEVVHN